MRMTCHTHPGEDNLDQDIEGVVQLELCDMRAAIQDTVPAASHAAAANNNMCM
jgi:hypothetical protein